MWTDPNINSAMGLQATAATKRKHEITFDSKDANAYTNCPPPVKTSRWSTPIINNNNSTNSNYNETTITTSSKTIILGNSSSTNNNNNAPNVNKNTCDESKISVNCNTNQSAAAVSNGNQVTITNGGTSSEDSIAKLEVVAAVPCEPWNTPEPVDCISKLQAVAVPSDPWGSISTRSTLATTLLSADELDDDDDDFEDDYEEEESIIPTYCPLRYHSCPPSGGGSGGNNASSANNGGGSPNGIQRSYSPAHGYNTRPNYYSEPFPQQNCSRTGNQHLRMGPGNSFTPQWGNSAGQNGFYVPPEAAYPPPQQTIRCAENGKSYLELGCSPASFSMTNQGSVGMVGSNGNVLDARHPLKRCCDGRAGTWCNTNKNCYKDVRLKIRNLSMFKLSRFRQVSEQSLHRSVLICNTLKYIDREIESEAKEMQHQQQQHHLSHHPHQSHLHHHVSHHTTHHHHHHNNHLHHPQQAPQQQTHQQQQQHQLQNQQQSNGVTADYSPSMGCARVTNLDYHQHQQQQQQQHNQFHSQPQPTDNRNGDCTQQSPYMSAMSKSSPFNTQPSQQHPHQQPSASQQQQQHQQQLQQQHCSSSDSLHPYDHYPFRETQSGRATPFPSTSSPLSAAPATPVNSTTTTTDNDSGYSEDESNRSINWSSVLSLSSQSALDPLNNNDLFTILPPATSSTSPPAAVPVPLSSASVSISGTFTASSVQSTSNSGSMSTSSTSAFTSSSGNNNTPTTFTTLSTISSSTYSLTSSSSATSSFASAAAAAASTWEYGLLDMEFGLGSEFTELVPTCKLSTDDLFKSVSPVSALSASRYSSVHDNELEHPAHIMVGS